MTDDKGGIRRKRSSRVPGPGKNSREDAAKEVGARIRQVRKDKLKMAQGEVAEVLGLSHGTVSYWERGGGAKPAHLREFAKLGGISMEYLVNGIDARNAFFHPRMGELEQRLMHRLERDLDELFDLFEKLLDLRDGRIERQRKGRESKR